jgi:hypothetical protein
MPGMDSALIVVGIIALIVIAAFIVVAAEKRRCEGLRRLAGELGLKFEEKLIGLPGVKLGRLNLFNIGHAHRARNALSGQYCGVDLTIFDYQYTSGSGKSQHTDRQTVAAFYLPDAYLPLFALRPEHVFHKIGSAFCFQDIDFDHFPTFSSSYLLRGEDERAVRELFNDNVLMFFESRPGLCVEGADDWLIVYRARRRVSPEHLSTFLDEAFEVRGVFSKR